MKKVNDTALMEVVCDLMSDNQITFRQFAIHFFKSRVKNKITFIKTLILTIKDIKKLDVVDSKNYHPSLFEENEK